jgi:REP element-mobilizing transposase RayT
MRQTGFSFLKNYKKEFGGSLLTGRRKIRRPLSTKHPIHLVLRTNRAKLFHPGNVEMNALIIKVAKWSGIKIYDLAVNWSHIHLLIKIPDRSAYNRFVRVLNSRIVLYFEQKSGWKLKGLFELRPYTKILTWGRQFVRALNYQVLNQIEAKFGKRARAKARNVCFRACPSLDSAPPRV